MIASNTTVKKDNLRYSGQHNLEGGYQADLLLDKSNELLKLTHSHAPDLLKIGVGGVDSKESFNSKLDNGASLVQIYTSFIYQGPKIVNKLLR